MSINLQRLRAGIGVGYSCPPRARGGSDDAAVVLLREDGTIDREIDAPTSDPTAGNNHQPFELSKVMGTETAGSVSAWVDSITRDGEGTSITCGAFHNPIVEIDGLGALLPAWRSVYSCRSVVGPNGPFTMGLRVWPGEGGAPFGGRADVLAGSGESMAPVWDLPISRAKIERSADPIATLRSEPLAGLQALVVPGAGVFVAFRYMNRLRTGWLDDSLRPRSELTTTDGLGGHLGRPAVALDGQEVLVVHSDALEREGRRAPRQPARLYAHRVNPGGTPAPAVLLDTSNVVGADGNPLTEYAPAVAPLPGGGWVVAWTRDTDDDGGAASVLVRSFSRALRPASEALTLSDSTSATDPELAPTTGGVVAVWMVGTRRTRSIVSAAIRCGANP